MPLYPGVVRRRVNGAPSRRRPTRSVLLACTFSAAVALAGCASGGSAGSSPTPAAAGSGSATASPTGATGASNALTTLQQGYVDVINKTLPSVVEISTSSGLGSGVILDTAGNIVTNAHVVGSATTFQVTLANSTKSLPAKLVGTYAPDDLAVVRVSGATGLRPATFADSSNLRVGDIVLAMGNPLGLSSSVTQGIVSATGRVVTEPTTADSPGATLPDAIQTSADINPGNSGGALVDLAGQVVGIPTLAALVEQEGGGAAPGIGFAIPSNIVRDIAGQLVKDGKVTSSGRAAVGARVVTVIGPDGNPAGVGIDSVTAGGPAAKAGLKAGDVITALNGQPTPDTQTLASVLAGLKPGQQISAQVTRAGGGTAKVTVTLGELPGTA